MTYRLQNLMLAMMLALSTLLLGLGNLSQNLTSGGYQLFERVDYGIADDNSLTALGNFDYFAKIASECCNAPNRVIDTPSGSTVRPLDSPHYSNAFEVQLPDSAYPGVSRQRHNQLSNQALHEAFEADPSFAAQIENLYPGIVNGVRPGARGAYPRSAATPDVTWHHGDNPGQMQLVPRDQHTTSGPVQDSLHPDGSGGYSNWGAE